MPDCWDLNWIDNSSTADYSSPDEFKKMSCSYVARYYDQIITRLQLQAIEENEYNKQQKERNLHGQKNNKKILLVDDEPDSCLVYEVVLQDAGYECTSYNDSVKALQEFRPNYYDLVILDIRMPKLDGFALCEKIREIDKAVPIIFITATEGHYDSFRRQYYPELSKDVNIKALQKPIGNDELVNIVNKTMAARDKN
jgi:two-component system, OmpR family, response regulator ChvI